jgi:asparagine synthase (glutamine-hydrolysing)
LSHRSFEIDEEYVAGWLSFFPAPHLTPYVGISSVPPSSFVQFSSRKVESTQYWDFEGAKRIRYSGDREYEEHFREVFFEAVRRRLRSDRPVLAELSGGMDSASIVCAADKIIDANSADFPRVDTLSYYNDFEPSWNERPYFSKVEEQRSRVGFHIDISGDCSSGFGSSDEIPLTPGSLTNNLVGQKLFLQCIEAQGNRVVLSGMGGDEVTGGVPSPSAELADLIKDGSLGQLARQLKVWALNKRRPWFHLLLETLRRFLPPDVFGFPAELQPAPWVSRQFRKRYGHALSGYENRLKLSRSLPSFQECLSNLDAVRRQFACLIETLGYPYEKRYPFLDRNLLEFLFSIPRSQLVRPGERRSLMRRALVNVVPDEIRMRRRKGYMSRQPLKVLNSVLQREQGPGSFAACSAVGWFDMTRLWDCLKAAKRGEQVPIVLLSRTIALELWMQSIRHSAAHSNTKAFMIKLPTFPGTLDSETQKQDSALAG